MRQLWLLPILLPAAAIAQTPDVVIRIEANPQLRIDSDGKSSFRWYDTLGRHSTVGLSMILEPGFRLFVTERLQRMPTDDDQLDEYYLEDEGNWRVGKQYLPFGQQTLLRESVQAVRVDSTLLIEGLPVSLAFCDGGDGRQKGAVARVGTWLGVSLALGTHFGIDGTSLALIRDPAGAPGKGRGYKQAVGVDLFKRYRGWRLQAEVVSLREGNTVADREGEVSDLSLSYQQSLSNSLVLGWSRDWRSDADFFRAQAKLLLMRGVWLEPLLRFRGSEFYDFGMALRMKM